MGLSLIYWSCATLDEALVWWVGKEKWIRLVVVEGRMERLLESKL